jgi:hypothetical protein
LIEASSRDSEIEGGGVLATWDNPDEMNCPR